MNLPQVSKQSDMSDHADVVFPPPYLLGISLVVGFLARRHFPLRFLSERQFTYLGPLIVGVSFSLCFWALYAMRRSRTTVNIKRPSTSMVSCGPFRFSRNPIYLSEVLLQVGVGVWANSLWFIGLAFLSVGLLTWGVISREECYLEDKFGQTYLSYCARVRRWF